jgi:hypothetical protein
MNPFISFGFRQRTRVLPLPQCKCPVNETLWNSNMNCSFSGDQQLWSNGPGTSATIVNTILIGRDFKCSLPGDR